MEGPKVAWWDSRQEVKSCFTGGGDSMHLSFSGVACALPLISNGNFDGLWIRIT